MVKIFLFFSDFGWEYLRVWPKKPTTKAQRHEEILDTERKVWTTNEHWWTRISWTGLQDWQEFLDTCRDDASLARRADSTDDTDFLSAWVYSAWPFSIRVSAKVIAFVHRPFQGHLWSRQKEGERWNGKKEIFNFRFLTAKLRWRCAPVRQETTYLTG